MQIALSRHLIAPSHHASSPPASSGCASAAFEAHDAEWAECNPEGFSYGLGGKHMRTDSSSSQLSSSPSAEFLNRYSTSSIAEDKAEIWACLMCYQQVRRAA